MRMNSLSPIPLFLPSAPCAGETDHSRSGVGLCNYATRIREAVHLIQLGARAGLVCQLTCLEKATVNRLYRELCGEPSPPGQMPFTDVWYRENDQRMLQATLVWRLHRRLAQTERGAARVLIEVFEAYTRLVREPLLDLTRTVFVPRLVAMGMWQERTCGFCRMGYLAPVDSHSIACPGCRLYHRHRCHQCGSALAAQSVGRRRVVCGCCGNTHNGGTRR
jgi:flagellar transcriptional activator FlhC